jgi:hypothetical protein
MIRIALFATALAAALPANAQQQPYKLILTAYQNTVVIDYPTAARCRAALDAVQVENHARARQAQQDQAAAKGGLIIPSYVSAFCLPG